VGSPNKDVEASRCGSLETPTHPVFCYPLVDLLISFGPTGQAFMVRPYLMQDDEVAYAGMRRGENVPREL